MIIGRVIGYHCQKLGSGVHDVIRLQDCRKSGLRGLGLKRFRRSERRAGDKESAKG